MGDGGAVGRGEIDCAPGRQKEIDGTFKTEKKVKIDKESFDTKIIINKVGGESHLQSLRY